MEWAFFILFGLLVWLLDAQKLYIVVLCILAAILYGIVHDQITARVCVEYFTIGHPPVFVTEDPTLLGLGWGILASWWVGLLLGIALAFVARAGRFPKVSIRHLLRPIGMLLLIMAVCALVGGLVGWALATSGIVFLANPLAEKVPASRHVPFIVASWAHAMSYLVALIGGIVVMVRVWRSRRHQAAAVVSQQGMGEPAKAR